MRQVHINVVKLQEDLELKQESNQELKDKSEVLQIQIEECESKKDLENSRASLKKNLEEKKQQFKTKIDEKDQTNNLFHL